MNSDDTFDIDFDQQLIDHIQAKEADQSATRMTQSPVSLPKGCPTHLPSPRDGFELTLSEGQLEELFPETA